MKKMITALTAGLIIAGGFVTSTLAAEHEVQPGESLWNIANQYDTTVDEIIDVNDLNTEVIQPRQVLLINPTYIVQLGDNLSTIAKEYNVSVDDLMEWNDLHTSLIVIGQELTIKGVEVDDEDAELETEEKQPSQVEETEEVTAEKAETQQSTQTEQKEGKTMSVTATAYTAGCDGCSGITYTGVDLNSNPNAKVIAVDPNVIPLGSEVYVEGYGYAVAADIGGAIKGNKIDLHVPTKDEAFSWGVQTVDITILN